MCAEISGRKLNIVTNIFAIGDKNMSVHKTRYKNPKGNMAVTIATKVV